MSTYDWDWPIKEIWEVAQNNPVDTPQYAKLVTLANLKNAANLNRYTAWLVTATILLVLCGIGQAVLLYLQINK